MRADRLEAVHNDLLVVSETNLENIEHHVEKLKPDLLVVDSIQTIFGQIFKVLPAVSARYGNVR